MKKLLSLFISLALFCGTTVFSQTEKQFPVQPPLTEAQLTRLSQVPEVIPPAIHHKLVLPSSVDNSTQPYFRPIFQQSGLECGQASSIGLGLTYELNQKRGVPGNVAQNQYATYFTYNFLNGGSDVGCSFMESFEIVKRCGNPTVADYGGLSAGGSSRWMSGYDKYYNSMHNRITDISVIYLNTLEGLNQLRSWIFNHMGQSSIGGVANFYSQFTSVNNQLPAGTPEGGKYVITSWGSSPNHAMTILGYNDSIRYDYNGDGQYTNNLDINGDGEINLKDYEIGGFKIANTYGTVYNWGDQGFSYAMYKSFADNTNNGGIWNNAAYIMYAKQDLSPKLTYKITLKHTSRNKIKVIAGVAYNLAATEPEVTLNLPIFDYQGGDKFMLGGTTEADKTIEFGLDATPLLSEIVSGQPAKFFLIIQENDPASVATGQLVSFDLIDYNSGTVVIPSGVANLPLIENGITKVTVNATLNFNNPSITNTSMPEAKIYEPYSYQMNSSGGTSPFKWRMAFDYSEDLGTGVFPAVTEQQLTVSNSTSGYASTDLPFQFPFYGKLYNRVFPHVDGYIMFDDHPVPWPYIIYERTFFKNTRCISPYMQKPLLISGGDNDGIWYQGCQDSVIFRWKLSQSGVTSTTEVNFTVTLFPDGRIKYNYGSMSAVEFYSWVAGFSNGDGLNFQYAAITDSISQPSPGTEISFATQPFPTEMSILETGLFTGTPQQTYTNLPVKFYVEDNNFLHSFKTLNFSTKGVEINYLVNAGGDTLIEYGENVYLTPVLKNVSSNVLHNVVLKIQVIDPYVHLTDSVEFIGTLNPGQIYTIQSAFTFNVLNSVPDNHLIHIISQLIATEDIFNRTQPFIIRAAEVSVSSVTYTDGGDNILMPGETGSLQVALLNSGGARATNLSSHLNTIDPYLNLGSGIVNIDTLSAGMSQLMSFPLTANANCPNPHIGYMTLHASGDKGIIVTDSVYINIGSFIEDFETGTFTKFPWQMAGNNNWELTTTLPYQGTYSAQSGTIIDNQECSLFLTTEILCGSEISFYRKVSSEVNYDFLIFYIDGQEKAKWAGEVPWGKVSFPVSAGTHIFKWVYKKDYSVSNGSDKAWIDYISWPPMEDFLLIAYAGPDDVACTGQGYTLAGQVLNATSIYWTTNGDGTFNGNNIPNAVYNPGPNDLSNGVVTLTLHASQPNVNPVSDNVMLNIHLGPTATAGPDLYTCPGNSVQINSANAQNFNSILWSSSGDGTFDNPTILSPVYTPGPNDIIFGNVNLYLTATGSAECNPVTDALILMMYSAVTTNAGNDLIINNNTSTQLNGSASGGSGTFSAQWEPASLLLDPTSFTPTTVNLTDSQIFTLTATNNSTGCLSSDDVLVTVIGGALSVTATADPNELCQGASSQLSALGSGGSGSYSYSWSSTPAGWSSTLQNPVVTPEITTQYSVILNDGFAVTNAQVVVTVNHIPAATLPQGPSAVNVLITPSTSYLTSSSAINQYEWGFSPAEAGTIVPSGATCTVYWIPEFDGIASLWVTASNICGTGPVSDTLYITANQEVGISNKELEKVLRLFPNPGKQYFSLEVPLDGTYVLKVLGTEGQVEYETCLPDMKTGIPYILDLGKLPAGCYFLHLGNELVSYSGKLVILK